MINTQTFTVPTGVFSTSGTKTEPDLATRVSGMEVNEGLPYEYFNYYINMLTANAIIEDDSVNAIIIELDNILSAASIVPDEEVHTQVLDSIQWLIEDYVTDYVSDYFKISNNLSEGVAATIRTNIAVYSKTEGDDRYCEISANLSEVTAATARTNLNVYSKAEVVPKTGGEFTGNIIVANDYPFIYISDNDSTANKRTACLRYQTGQFMVSLANDAGTPVLDLLYYNWATQAGVATCVGYRNSAGVESEVMEKTKIIEIGDWNMDTTIYKYVNHGLTFAKIISAKAMIINDSGNVKYNLEAGETTSGGIQGYIKIESTQMELFRLTGGWFDNTGFDATSFNRGFIHVKYLV